MSALTLSDVRFRLVLVTLSSLVCIASQAQAGEAACPAALHNGDVVEFDSPDFVASENPATSGQTSSSRLLDRTRAARERA